MRKRLVIGAIAVLVIGVAVKVLLGWEPKEGTVAWHKREFLRIRFPVSFQARVQDKWERVIGRPSSQNLAWLQAASGDGARYHALALEKLGYLRRRRVKYDPFRDSPNLWDKAKERLPKRHVWWIGPTVNEYCDVLYEPRDEACWEEMILEVNAKTE